MMSWSLFLRYIAYGTIIAIYGVFAWYGKAPVEGFIAVLTGAIALLGGQHAAESAVKAANARALPPVPQQPAQITAPTIVTRELP